MDPILPSAAPYKAKSAAQIKQMASELESFFYQTLLKELRENDESDPLFEESSLNHWKELQHEEIAKKLGEEGHLGLGPILLQEHEKREKGSIAPKGWVK